MSASDKKKLPVASSHVIIKVKNHEDDVDVYFRMKRDIELRKMMEAFSAKVGEQMSAFVFLLDGTRIYPNQTPNEVNLEDGDQIDVVFHQRGGLSSCALSELF